MALPPKKYEYTAEDFLTPAPYEQLYSYVASPFIFQTETLKMAERAKEVRFSGFKDMLRKYIDAQSAAKRRNLVPNQTEFDGQEIELNCGTWDSLDYGIFRDTPNGGRECACAHPIMPVERLVNIDTGEVKLKLAYKRSGKAKKWNTTIVDKSTISTARTITGLASQGISVTSTSSSRRNGK